MKKLVTLLLAAGLVFAASAPASAADVKITGSAEMIFEGMRNMGGYETSAITGLMSFMDSSDAKHNFPNGYNTGANSYAAAANPGATTANYHQKSGRAVQRFILGMQIVASENLSAYFDVVAGFFTWGGPAAAGQAGATQGGALGTRGSNITTRQAYIDWTLPSTNIKVRMGQQAWITPFFSVGTTSPFAEEFGSGIIVTVPFNNKVSATVGWLRAMSESRRGNFATLNTSQDDLGDFFVATLPVRLDGFRFTPWGSIGIIGKDAGIGTAEPYFASWLPRWAAVPGAAIAANLRQGKPRLETWGDSTLWWIGFGGEITKFAPWRFALDVAYSKADTDNGNWERSGWFVGASAAYRTAYGVPTLKAWYASGDDDNITNGSERPVAVGGMLQSGATRFFGPSGLGGAAMDTFQNWSVGGTWGVGVSWNNLSLVKGLLHNFAVTYIRGTNDPFMAGYADPRAIHTYLTKDDSVVEIDLESVYSIYPNLAVVLELNYLIENIDGGTWNKTRNTAGQIAGYRTGNANSDMQFSNAWHVGLNFRYTF